jgi:hypothetical protein
VDRICAPELLDQLSPEDPRAIRSRRDLRRVNWWMGNARIMADSLNRILIDKPSTRILEVGAGDGHFLAEVLRDVHAIAERKNAVLLDQQHLLTQQMEEIFRGVGWQAKAIKSDVFQWFDQNADRFDAIIANLFLHHFSSEYLTRLFSGIAAQTDLFIAVEPRRAGVSLFAGKFLWMIGCNSVTRHDAIVSIRAGFANRELTALWPKDTGWVCDERPAGFSSHLFIARKSS